MADRVKILGQYLYRADARPQGARNWRRALFAATTEFEITSLSVDEVWKDAMVFLPAGARQPVSLTGLPSGGLARHAGLNGPLRLEQYRDLLASWASTITPVNPLFPGIERIPLRYDPIATSPPPDERHAWPDLDGLDVYVEDTFRGSIGVSDKPAAHARYLDASRHVMLIDGVVHYSSSAPAWLVEGEANEPTTVRLIDRLPGFGRMGFHQPEAGKLDGERRTIDSVGLGLFASERLEDAMTWARSRYPGTKIIQQGKLVHADQVHAPADPMAAPVHCVLEDLVSLIEACKNHLDADAFTTWGRLNDHGKRFTPYGAEEVPPLPNPLDGLGDIRKSLDGRMLPCHVQATAQMLIASIDALTARADFERSLTHELAEEDDLALSSTRIR